MGTVRNCVSAMTFRPFTLICGLALLASCAGLPVDDEQKEDSVLAVFKQAAKNQVQEQIQEDSVNDATDGGEEVLDQESVRVDSARSVDAAKLAKCEAFSADKKNIVHQNTPQDWKEGCARAAEYEAGDRSKTEQGCRDNNVLKTDLNKDGSDPSGCATRFGGVPAHHRDNSCRWANYACSWGYQCYMGKRNCGTAGGEEVLDQESVRVDSERTFEAHHGPGNSFPTCLRPGFGEVALKYGRREHYYNACTPHHRGGWINKGHVMAVDKSCCASGQVKCTGTSGKYTWGDGANKNIGDASSPYACMWDFQCMPGPGTTAGGCSGYYKRSSPRQGQNRNSLPQIKRLDRSNQRNTNMAAEVAACKSVCDAASDCDSFIYRSHEGSSNWRGSRYGHHHCWFFGPPPSGWKLDPETTGLVGQWDHWYTKCDGSGALTP